MTCVDWGRGLGTDLETPGHCEIYSASFLSSAPYTGHPCRVQSRLLSRSHEPSNNLHFPSPFISLGRGSAGGGCRPLRTLAEAWAQGRHSVSEGYHETPLHSSPSKADPHERIWTGMCKPSNSALSSLLNLFSHKLSLRGTSMVVQWLRLGFPIQGVWVQSLVGELGSHMPRGQRKPPPILKQNQYCNIQ